LPYLRECRLTCDSTARRFSAADLARLAADQAQAEKRGAGASDPAMIGYTLPEIRRLLSSLVQACAPDLDAVWSWSRWRRRRQYQARQCRYRQRGYAFT
jgi:hypothetical protein